MVAEESLVPRHYQSEILQHAIKENVIAYMETGSGKTYIAVMLIRWMAAQPFTERKIIVFMACTNPLVKQQVSFIKSQTELEVRGYSGMDKDINGVQLDSWNISQWMPEFESVDVMVMTPALLVNILGHGYWDMSKISLLIFDEIHHCNQNHPYNQLMRDFYKSLPTSSRPKIFGMTASIVRNIKKSERQQIAELEANADAKIHSVKLNASELEKHAHKPNEMVVCYSTLSAACYASLDMPSLWASLTAANLLRHPSFRGETLSVRYDVAVQSLGLYAGDYHLFTHLTDQVRRESTKLEMEERYIRFAFGITAGTLQATDEDTTTEGDSLAKDLADIVGKLDAYAPYFEATFQPSPQQHFSPKVQKLLEILGQKKSIGFQGIIFVEQRHVATTLCHMLSQLSDFEWLRPATLMGHGDVDTRSFGAGMKISDQQDVCKRFMQKEYNLLIATSVAEEGLDFPECDLIIRFDGLQHMVGYLQSRGRARRPDSHYVVMIADNEEAGKVKYQKFIETEAEIKSRYESREDVDLDEDMDEPDALLDLDLNNRETYTVPATGAKVTFDTAVVLLAHFCSLIPHDRYTPPFRPTYSDWQEEDGLYMASVTLPSALPIDAGSLRYDAIEGRYTKKEARRAAAFEAVCELHRRFQVFNDNLLPMPNTVGLFIEDADGIPIKSTKDVPATIDTLVFDPWCTLEELWIHPINAEGVTLAGLVTGSSLLPTHVSHCEKNVGIGTPTRLEFGSELERDNALNVMSTFTACCIAYCATGKQLPGPLTCYIVPLQSQTLSPDLEAMSCIPSKGNRTQWVTGSDNWRDITPVLSGRLLADNLLQLGRPVRILDMETGLTASSPLQADSLISPTAHGNYKELFQDKVLKRNMRLTIPDDDPLLLVHDHTRVVSSSYDLETLSTSPAMSSLPYLLPKCLCRWVPIPFEIVEVYSFLPPLLQRITDCYRAQCVHQRFALPDLDLSRTVEALKLPTCHTTFSNQRLETLGDTVLKLAVVVHVFNKYSNMHEGQLTALKTNCVSNRVLMSRGLDLDLLPYTTCESHNTRKWRWTLVNSTDQAVSGSRVRRLISRRSVQDCMESLLGAAFCTGGIAMSLKMGARLNLSMGGEELWSHRYSLPNPEPSLPLFRTLESKLGYTFRHSSLLREAFTHPSFGAIDVPCYQRLEMLGDALIDMAITEDIFNRFPEATSGQVTWARSRLVCASTLSLIAVKELGLHKLLLHNNPELGKAVFHYVAILEECSYSEMIHRGWNYDPPKVISDLTESVFGAMLIDSGYDYDICKQRIGMIFAEPLSLASPDLPRDPSAELMMWITRSGCRKARFQKLSTNPNRDELDGVTVIVHDEPVVIPPAQGINMTHAKSLASERARATLSDDGEHPLSQICTCKTTTVPSPVPPISLPTSNIVDEEDLQPGVRDLETSYNEETTSGFASKGQHLLEVLDGGAPTGGNENESESENESDNENETVEADPEGVGNVDAERLNRPQLHFGDRDAQR